MGSLAALETDEVLDRVLGAGRTGSAGTRDVRNQLAAAHQAAWAATSPRLLELCRLRIASLLGCTAELDVRTPGAGIDVEVVSNLASWPTDPHFDAADRACLAFTEHYVLDVASIDDDTVAAVRDQLGEEGVQNFVSALLVVEQRIRLRLMWDRLLLGGC